MIERDFETSNFLSHVEPESWQLRNSIQVVQHFIPIGGEKRDDGWWLFQIVRQL